MALRTIGKCHDRIGSGFMRDTYFQYVYLFGTILIILVLILIKYVKIYLFSAKMIEKAKIREYLEKMFNIPMIFCSGLLFACQQYFTSRMNKQNIPYGQ